MQDAAQKPRVVIGSNYRPTRFERRTAISYSALRPEPTHDDIRLQRGLTLPPLSRIGAVDPERVVGIGIAVAAAIVMVLTAVGVIQ